MAPVSTGFADLDNDHHIAIYRIPDDSIDCQVVSLLEASRRIGRREPVVCRDRGDGAAFVMSLSPGDSLELSRNGETKIRVVESVWTSSQVVMVDHDDAGRLAQEIGVPGKLCNVQHRQLGESAPNTATQASPVNREENRNPSASGTATWTAADRARPAAWLPS